MTAVRRFTRHRLAVAGLAVLVLVILAAVFADVLSAHDPAKVDLAAVRQPPSAEHWLGTDESGRDVLSRLLHAGRVSLLVGILSSLIAITLGTVLGAVAGLVGGWADSVIMRTADIFLSFPVLVVMIVIGGIIGPSVPLMIIAIGVFTWPTAGRVVRGSTLSLREQEFILAARAIGARTSWLVFRHIIPAVLGSVVVVGTLAVATGILLEASLSFLGIGVQPPQPSWGNMLTDAQRLTVISQMPWLWIPPGVAVAITVLSVNFVGDGLRDAVDPR
jgi:ABC-type dipeptide/oligopeptide/nickel transport system permease subunit